MDKKNKIIIVICVIVIVVAIGIATSVAIINNRKEPLEVDDNNTINLENEKQEPVLDYDKDKDLNEVTDEDLDKLLQ